MTQKYIKDFDYIMYCAWARHDALPDQMLEYIKKHGISVRQFNQRVAVKLRANMPKDNGDKNV